jgi:hypothetical protein
MRTCSKLLLATLVATLAFGLAVGGATARRLRMSSTSFSVRWRSFFIPTGTSPEREEENGEGSSKICPLTLSGSFHSATISKVVGTLVGYVNNAQMGTCTGEGGRVTLLTTGLPWHLTYREFSGLLPSIQRFRLALAGFAMSIEVPPFPYSGTVCLIRTTTTEPLNFDLTREAGGAITSVEGYGLHIDARDTTSWWCDTPMPPYPALAWSMGGAATLDNGRGARVTVTLI